MSRLCFQAPLMSNDIQCVRWPTGAVQGRRQNRVQVFVVGGCVTLGHEICDQRRCPAEMNLGLGVLEEQKHGVDGILLPRPNSDSDEDSDNQGAMAADPELDIFAALLGKQSHEGKLRPTIAEL